MRRIFVLLLSSVLFLAATGEAAPGKMLLTTQEIINLLDRYSRPVDLAEFMASFGEPQVVNPPHMSWYLERYDVLMVFQYLPEAGVLSDLVLGQEFPSFPEREWGFIKYGKDLSSLFGEGSKSDMEVVWGLPGNLWLFMSKHDVDGNYSVIFSIRHLEL